MRPDELLPLRFLEEAMNATDDAAMEDEEPSDGQVLRDTFIVYGSAFVVIFLLFCFVRQRFPRPYTLRQWVDDIQTPLADNQYGFFSWMWKLFFITEDEMMNECGMDSLCFLRMLRCGFKISLLCIFNAIWLLPLYGTAADSEETAGITDKAATVTISHVPSGSKRLIATALAAYLLFGYVMYVVYKEFEWFTEQRHKFLQKLLPRNFAVYVQNIPQELCNKAALEKFFSRVFSKEAVLEANFRVKASNLAKIVANRDKTLGKLEHAIAYEEVKGTQPTHSSSMIGGTKVNSIEVYAEELKELNQDVTQRINTIERDVNATPSVEPSDSESVALVLGNSVAVGADDAEASLLANEVTQVSTKGGSVHSVGDVENPASSQHFSSASEENNKQNLVSQGVTSFKASAAVGMSLAKSIVLGEEDGKLYNAAFVTFTKLSAVHGAQQIIHSATPFAMEVLEAPEPEDIYWPNVGRQHKDLQVGKLMSFALTTVLCLLWTIPMAFFASLSSVQGLKDQFDALADAIERFPFLEPLLEQLAPLLVVVFNSLLPVFLTLITLLEGQLSGATVDASLFAKLAVFEIVQTFFVSAISGGIFQELANIIEDPASIIDLLATSLPEKSTYFMQILIAGTVVMVGIELLRVVPLAMAALRSCIGPRLTEKERQTAFMGLRPLADPSEFQHSDVFSVVVLYFMVVMVYAVIAPLVAFVSAFCFVYMSAAYRHQFVYVYPPTPDSGGRLWLNCVRILTVCMIIAEITITGLLALKKSAVATILMVPLIVIQILFNTYIGQQHFKVPDHLPSMDSLKADLKNGELDVSFLEGAFVQPELQTKERVPEGLSESQQLLLGFNYSDTSETDVVVHDESPSDHLYSDALQEVTIEETQGSEDS